MKWMLDTNAALAFKAASILRRFAPMFSSENWTNPTTDSTQNRGPVFSVH